MLRGARLTLVSNSNRKFFIQFLGWSAVLSAFACTVSAVDLWHSPVSAAIHDLRLRMGSEAASRGGAIPGTVLHFSLEHTILRHATTLMAIAEAERCAHPAT
jgi:hypothetical protein